MMSTQVEPEDVFEGTKGRLISRIKGFLTDTYARDREDVLEDLADILDTESLPKADIEIVLHLGKQVITVSGFEAAEDDEDTEDNE